MFKYFGVVYMSRRFKDWDRPYEGGKVKGPLKPLIRKTKEKVEKSRKELKGKKREMSLREDKLRKKIEKLLKEGESDLARAYANETADLMKIKSSVSTVDVLSEAVTNRFSTVEQVGDFVSELETATSNFRDLGEKLSRVFRSAKLDLSELLEGPLGGPLNLSFDFLGEPLLSDDAMAILKEAAEVAKERSK